MGKVKKKELEVGYTKKDQKRVLDQAGACGQAILRLSIDTNRESTDKVAASWYHSLSSGKDKDSINAMGGVGYFQHEVAACFDPGLKFDRNPVIEHEGKVVQLHGTGKLNTDILLPIDYGLGEHDFYVVSQIVAGTQDALKAGTHNGRAPEELVKSIAAKVYRDYGDQSQAEKMHSPELAQQLIRVAVHQVMADMPKAETEETDMAKKTDKSKKKLEAVPTAGTAIQTATVSTADAIIGVKPEDYGAVVDRKPATDDAMIPEQIDDFMLRVATVEGIELVIQWPVEDSVPSYPYKVKDRAKGSLTIDQFLQERIYTTLGIVDDVEKHPRIAVRLPEGFDHSTSLKAVRMATAAMFEAGRLAAKQINRNLKKKKGYGRLRGVKVNIKA